MTDAPTAERGGRPVLPFRALVPNAITLLVLCTGLTGARFALEERWPEAVLAIVIAAILDALDGRIARLLKAQTRFGAELDSLADVIAFGVAPAIIIYLWVLHALPGNLGWAVALAHAAAAALRLARFNASIDADAVNPRKALGFFTGIPAPAGAGLLLLPVYGTLAFGERAASVLTEPALVAPWVLGVAVLMISTAATPSWSLIRPRPAYRMAALLLVGVFGASLLTSPFLTLSVAAAIYASSVLIAMLAYARLRQRVTPQPRRAAR